MVENAKKQEEIIFYQALEKSPQDRETYIKEACGDNYELYNRVNALLQAYDTDDKLHHVPIADSQITLESPPNFEGPGTVIDRYKLLEKIGEGGMAVVYLAEQEEPIRRKIAFKIIKLGMDTKSVIARFEVERQALAMMDHPNIAKVLDAGATETGRPYFVMELVTGVSITEYCNKKNLSIKERLTLFIQVCNAIQHAHQKGIIHRDIKPSNVMVALNDSKPIPKVIDFGIAKATNQRLTEKTIFTRYAHIIGTPAYMSPEQAEFNDLDVDTRTDIYSLGVLLYELLTGTTPFSEEKLREAGYLQMQKIICEEEPTKPSTKLSTLGDTLTEVAKQRCSTPDLLRKSLSGDLDWIVMKALDKKRDRRYNTSSGLSADIERHLNHQPVEAAAPTLSYRTRKFVKRHFIGVVFAVLILVMLLVLSFSSVLIWKEQRQTQQALEREKTARRLETRARAEAQRQAKIAEAVADFLNKDILTSVKPHKARGRDITVAEILDKASNNITRRFRDEPLIEASVRRTLGSTYTELGQFDEAAHQLERVRDLYTEHLGEDDPTVLEFMASLGWLYVNQRRYQEAEPLLMKMIENSERVLGYGHKITANPMNSLGVMYKNQGRYEDAERLYLKAIEILKRSVGQENLHTTNVTNNLAAIYDKQGRTREAEELYLSILQSDERRLGKDHPDTLRCMNNLGVLFKEQGRYEQAESLLKRAAETMERVLGEEHVDSMRTKSNLARLYDLQGRYLEAEPLFLRLVKVKERIEGEEHPDTLEHIERLAVLYCKDDRFANAEPLLRKLFETGQRLYGEDHSYTLSAMHNLGRIYNILNRYEEAESMLRRVAEIDEQVLGLEHHDTYHAIKTLVSFYEARGKPEQARKWQAKLQEDDVGPLSFHVIPDENLAIPDGLQACAVNLEKIYAAITEYHKDRLMWPEWLSDLVPNYLAEDTLVCPDDAGRVTQHLPDPKLPCSYSWEYSSYYYTQDPNHKTSYRERKHQQARFFGDIVPLVRCYNHGDKEILNLSMGGQIYVSDLNWEYVFQNAPQVEGEQPGQSTDETETTVITETLIGKYAPSFSLEDLDGRQVNLSDFRGKVVLLNFWSSWSPPCAKAMPYFEILYKKYNDEDLVIVGLNDEENQAEIKELIEGWMSYPVLMGADKQFEEYGVKNIPTLIYIDREGKVCHCDKGFMQDKEKEIEAKIRELLGYDSNNDFRVQLSYSRASRPSPSDKSDIGTTSIVELQWVLASDTVANKVYFGTDPQHLELLGEVQGENKISSPQLERQRWYYWRADTVRSDGSEVEGRLWSFSTGAMVGWWRFDETEGLTAADSSGRGNHGKLIGGPRWQQGHNGGALAFDGVDDYVSIRDTPDLDITKEITVTCWIQIDQFNIPWQAIIAKGNQTWRIIRAQSLRSIEFACTGVDVPNTTWGCVYGKAVVDDGQWHHIAGVYDGTQVYLYVDGVLDASIEGSGRLNADNADVLIGANTGDNWRFWNGLIDDIRVYSYALSAEEVGEVYAGRGPGPNIKPPLE